MRFVYVLDMEVATAQVMLNILLQRGFLPELVIEESSQQADHHRNLWAERLAGKKLAPTIASQVEKYNLRYTRVQLLNGLESQNIINKEKPDLIVIGGTRRLIKENIFSIPSWGTLLSHPGLLPQVRGASSVAWSIYYDIKVGSSCIFIDRGYDTGPIIESKIVPVYKGDSYDEVIERSIIYSGELMAEVLTMFKDKMGPIQGEPQDLYVGYTYKTIPPELVVKVKAKLAEGTYRWLEPKPS